MTLFRIKFSSYDGCTGWSSWYGDDVYVKSETAKADAIVYERRGCRCEVVPFESK